jgi:RNA methyltransferase, TrmH family
MEQITSRQNPLVKRFRELASHGASNGDLLLDGEHLLSEALASGVPVEVALVSNRLATAPFIVRASKSGARIVAVSDQVLAAVSPVHTPSGVVAIAHKEAATLEHAARVAPQLMLVLNGVQDAGNVGAIVRAAEACGATGIVTTEGTADPFGWKALRGGMGSTFRVPIAVRQPVDAALTALRERGVRTLATVPNDGTPLPDCDLRGPHAIVLGAEGAGLPEAVLARCDARLSIPMRAPVESLNVSIAAALVVYEASRQRNVRSQGVG